MRLFLEKPEAYLDGVSSAKVLSLSRLVVDAPSSTKLTLEPWTDCKFLIT